MGHKDDKDRNINAKNIIATIVTLGVITGAISGILTLDDRYAKIEQHQKHQEAALQKHIDTIEKLSLVRLNQEFIFRDQLTKVQVEMDERDRAGLAPLARLRREEENLIKKIERSEQIND